MQGHKGLEHAHSTGEKMMSEKLKFMWWRVRLVRYLIKYKYWGILGVVSAWEASGDESWSEYYESETHPEDAVIEDLSYA